MKTKLDLILLAILCMTSCIAYAEPVTKTYTFTSKTWEAIDETGTVANWINGSNGYGFSSDKGVQVTTNGANTISTKYFKGISKIVFTYYTNEKKGKGSISTNIGDNSSQKNNVTYSTGSNSSTSYTSEFNYSTPQNGYINFMVTVSENSIYIKSISITYDSNSSVDAPVFSPKAGTYLTTQDVTISCGTEGAEIHYTTDGTQPTTDSQLYDEPIHIDKTTTINAVAIKDNEMSDIVIESYIIINGDELSDGVFNFGLKYDYGSGMTMKPSGNTSNIDQTEKIWTSGHVIMKTSGRVLWYEGGQLYLYSTVNTASISDKVGTCEFSVPNGIITQIGITTELNHEGIAIESDGSGKISNGYWEGSAKKVTIKHNNSSSSGVSISKITVTYTLTTVSTEIGSTGYSTFCSEYALDFSDVAAPAAYTVSSISETTATLTRIQAAPANTPVILNAAEGKYNLNIIDYNGDVGKNYLKVSDGKIQGNNSNIYALASKDGIVGFHVVSEGVDIPNGKCYLEIDRIARSRLEFNWDMIDAIKDIDMDKSTYHDTYYNLNGQRVNNPSKGIYILNNKKILIK